MAGSMGMAVGVGDGSAEEFRIFTGTDVSWKEPSVEYTRNNNK